MALPDRWCAKDINITTLQTMLCKVMKMEQQKSLDLEFNKVKWKWHYQKAGLFSCNNWPRYRNTEYHFIENVGVIWTTENDWGASESFDDVTEDMRVTKWHYKITLEQILAGSMSSGLCFGGMFLQLNLEESEGLLWKLQLFFYTLCCSLKWSKSKLLRLLQTLAKIVVLLFHLAWSEQIMKC